MLAGLVRDLVGFLLSVQGSSWHNEAARILSSNGDGSTAMPRREP